MPPTLFPKRAPEAPTPCSKIKHRRLASQGQEASPWASLPEDLVDLIGWRVLAGDLLDYVHFRAVCSHWNSSTLRPRGRGLLDPRFHPRRWMMLPEGHGLYPGHPNLGGYVRFFNLSTGVFVRVHLPLFDDHVVLDSVDGLLLLLRHRDHGTAIRLLHPFTGDIAELPPLLSLLPQIESQARFIDMSEYSKLRKLHVFLRGVCAAFTISATGVFTVMLALDVKRRVAHANVGDQSWTLSAWQLPGWLASTVSFQGKLYTVSLKSPHKNIVGIRQIDPPQSNMCGSHSLYLEPPRMIAECPVVGIIGVAVHLVECGSELMLVGLNYYPRRDPVVYRLTDLISGRIVPVTNIGDHALFLGERSICLSPNKKLPSVLGNTITGNLRLLAYHQQLGSRGLRRPVEHYHLVSGTWSPATDENICNDTPLPSPYMLIYHIHACCYRTYWNKGHMYREVAMPDWSVKPNLWIGV